MNAQLLDFKIIIGVCNRIAMSDVYKDCKQKQYFTDLPEDNEAFFRLWELHSRKLYFNNQIKELDEEINEIIGKYEENSNFQN